jgi:hypothetical protein
MDCCGNTNRSLHFDMMSWLQNYYQNPSRMCVIGAGTKCYTTLNPPDDEDAVLQVRQRAEAHGLHALPEGGVLDRQHRDVALGADREYRRHELGVAAAPPHLHLLDGPADLDSN